MCASIWSWMSDCASSAVFANGRAAGAGACPLAAVLAAGAAVGAALVPVEGAVVPAAAVGDADAPAGEAPPPADAPPPAGEAEPAGCAPPAPAADSTFAFDPPHAITSEDATSATPRIVPVFIARRRIVPSGRLCGSVVSRPPRDATSFVPPLRAQQPRHVLLLPREGALEVPELRLALLELRRVQV